VVMKESIEVKSPRRCWLMSSRVKYSSFVIRFLNERERERV
jgi:hypothetical protein